MKFWDSSALVPICLNSSQSKYCMELFKSDSNLIVWCLTMNEIWSALSSQSREKNLNDENLLIAKKRVRELSQVWSEIVAIERVRERSLRLMEVHELKAADSLQLAAALVAANEQTHRFEFVCLDKRLAKAATKEGFLVHEGNEL